MAENPRPKRNTSYSAMAAAAYKGAKQEIRDLDSADSKLPFEGLSQATSEPVPPLQQSAPVDVEISTTNFSDAPTQQDSLGFAPYVRAVAWFLIDPKTSPPLTLSIEGPWGSGKSSFMLQLASRLRVLADERDDVGEVRCVWFNPWKNDKDEALWASFALTLVRQLERGTPWRKRATAKLRLLYARVEWPKLVIPAASLVVFVALTTLILVAPTVKNAVLSWFPKGASYAPVLTALAALTSALAAARHLLGNPLPKSLAGYIRKPQLGDRVPLIERFSREFSETVNAYVGRNGRVFVFIDDLDRCEVPRAAELMQAINLLMASDLQSDFETDPAKLRYSNLVFVLGIDREMVAAGIAAKNASVLRYLASRDGDGRVAADPHRYGIEFGYAFLEKFIQTPFHLPRVRREGLEPWIKGFLGLNDTTAHSSGPAPDADRGALLEGKDPERFEDVVLAVSAAFRFGPRRIKQFVNVLRLQVAIAIQTGQLVRAPAEATGAGIPVGLTLERLALVTAILLEWPSLVGRIFEDPSLLAVTPADDSDFPDLAAIIASLGSAYGLIGLDITSLVEVMPDAYPAASLGQGGRQRTRLAPAAVEPDPTSPPTSVGSPPPPPPSPVGEAAAPLSANVAPAGAPPAA